MAWVSLFFQAYPCTPLFSTPEVGHLQNRTSGFSKVLSPKHWQLPPRSFPGNELWSGFPLTSLHAHEHPPKLFLMTTVRTVQPCLLKGHPYWADRGSCTFGWKATVVLEAFSTFHNRTDLFTRSSPPKFQIVGSRQLPMNTEFSPLIPMFLSQDRLHVPST